MILDFLMQGPQEQSIGVLPLCTMDRSHVRMCDSLAIYCRDAKLRNCWDIVKAIPNVYFHVVECLTFLLIADKLKQLNINWKVNKDFRSTF
jgi:hypothetical protein